MNKDTLKNYFVPENKNSLQINEGSDLEANYQFEVEINQSGKTSNIHVNQENIILKRDNIQNGQSQVEKTIPSASALLVKHSVSNKERFSLKISNLNEKESADWLKVKNVYINLKRSLKK